MRHRLIATLMMVLLISLTVTPAFAFDVRLSGAIQFGLSTQKGSAPNSAEDVPQLVARGHFEGLNEPRDVVVELEGRGFARMACRTASGELMPGQHSLDVNGRGFLLLHFEGYVHDETQAFQLDTPQMPLDLFLSACPSGAASVSDIQLKWEEAYLQMHAADTHELLFAQSFTCISTSHSVECTPREQD